MKWIERNHTVEEKKKLIHRIQNVFYDCFNITMNGINGEHYNKNIAQHKQAGLWVRNENESLKRML